MRHDPHGDDARPLDELERATLARIERSLMVEEPRLSARLSTGMRTRGRAHLPSWVPWAGAVGGAAAIAGGIGSEMPLVGGVGFVVAVVSLDRLADRGHLRLPARLRQALGLHEH